MIKLIIFGIIIIAMILGLQHFISDYDKCYSEMEDDGIAVFGCCGGVVGGTRNTGYLSEMCIDCPYYTPINQKEDKK